MGSLTFEKRGCLTRASQALRPVGVDSCLKMLVGLDSDADRWLSAVGPGPQE